MKNRRERNLLKTPLAIRRCSKTTEIGENIADSISRPRPYVIEKLPPIFLPRLPYDPEYQQFQ